MVLGAAALVATGIGAFAVAGAGIAGIGTFTGIGSALGLAAGIANVGAQALAKPPAARGSVTQLIIEPNPPQPYVMGEGYFAGVLRHQAAYGGEVNDVQNPYLGRVVVYSGGGPIQSIAPRVDFAPVSSWYSGFLGFDTQLGATPEATALTPEWPGMPGWTTAHKLSGQAAMLWSHRFDKKGKRFASGLPQEGAEGQWVKAYDPRKDSTFPGGVGTHRLGIETTYEWTENPALHAGTYAFGRFQNGKRTIGIGLPGDAIDWQAIAAWANICEANNWTMFGVVFEGVGLGEAERRWANLSDICAAGGAEPVPGGVLTFRWHAPVVALDTITEADNAGGDDSVVAMQSYRDRVNIIIPEYLMPDQNWARMPGEPVVLESFIAEDGEEKARQWTFNFVKEHDQAAQLAAYKGWEARELHPIELHCMPRMRGYRPGDCLHIDRPDLGLDTDAIILAREVDPGDMTVRLTLVGETPAKHAFCLGRTGVAPPTPALVQTAQERDETAANATDRQVQVEVVALKRYAADYTGTVNAGLLPDAIVPTVTYGGSAARADDETHYTISTDGVTATVNDTDGDAAKGKITITAVNAINGWVDLTVTIAGQAQPTKRILIQRQDGLPSGFGGTGAKIASDNNFPELYAASFAPVTDSMTVTLASGESLYGTAPLDYIIERAGATASREVSAKWQYSPAGAGTWTDFGTAITGSLTAELPNGDVGTGSGNFSHNAGGMAAGDYDVRLVAALNASGRTVYVNGTATIEAKP